MKSIKLSQKGFSHIAVFALVAVFAVLGLVGYRVLTKDKAVNDPTSASTVKVPTTFKSKADISQAATSLDATDVGKTLDPNQLDSDLSSLL